MDLSHCSHRFHPYGRHRAWFISWVDGQYPGSGVKLYLRILRYLHKYLHTYTIGYAFWSFLVKIIDSYVKGIGFDNQKDLNDPIRGIREFLQLKIPESYPTKTRVWVGMGIYPTQERWVSGRRVIPVVLTNVGYFSRVWVSGIHSGAQPWWGTVRPVLAVPDP
jgi:hypothetical protein